MATNVYEGMFMLDSNRWASNSEGLLSEMVALLQRQGAEVIASRAWDDRRLAYPIRGHRKALYWLSYFRIDGSKISEIERQCRLKDAVLRQLILRIDPKLVDHLLAQLETGYVERKEPEEARTPRVRDVIPDAVEDFVEEK